MWIAIKHPTCAKAESSVPSRERATITPASFGSSQRSFWLELICAAMQCTCRVFESAHRDMENFSGTYHSAIFVCTQVDSVEFLVRSAISRQSCDCHNSYDTDMSWLLCVMNLSHQREKCLRRSWEPVTLIQQTGTSPLFVVSR